MIFILLIAFLANRQNTVQEKEKSQSHDIVPNEDLPKEDLGTRLKSSFYPNFSLFCRPDMMYQIGDDSLADYITGMSMLVRVRLVDRIALYQHDRTQPTSSVNRSFPSDWQKKITFLVKKKGDPDYKKQDVTSFAALPPLNKTRRSSHTQSSEWFSCQSLTTKLHGEYVLFVTMDGLDAPPITLEFKNPKSNNDYGKIELSRARVLFKEKKFKNVISLIIDSHSKYGPIDGSKYLLGKAYNASGQCDKALIEYREVLKEFRKSGQDFEHDLLMMSIRSAERRLGKTK